MKAEVGKLDINKLAKVRTSLNNLKTIVDDLNVDKLKTIPIDLKRLTDVADNDIVKNTEFNTLKTEVDKVNKKIPDVTTLIQINQCNTYKVLEKKIGDFGKKKYLKLAF